MRSAICEHCDVRTQNGYCTGQKLRQYRDSNCRTFSGFNLRYPQVGQRIINFKGEVVFKGKVVFQPPIDLLRVDLFLRFLWVSLLRPIPRKFKHNTTNVDQRHRRHHSFIAYVEELLEAVAWLTPGTQQHGVRHFAAN